MKAMFFYDLENLKKSLLARDGQRMYHYGYLQRFLLKFLTENLHYEMKPGNLVRTYAYTGEYSRELLEEIQQKIDSAPDEGKKQSLGQLLESTKRRMEAQSKFFGYTEHFSYFELRTCPLKFDGTNIYQKGVDVMIATDMVGHAFKDNFDICILCSGDLDLVEPLRTIKNLGKTTIVMGHPQIMSGELAKVADFVIDVERMDENSLSEFSKVRSDAEHDHSDQM